MHLTDFLAAFLTLHIYIGPNAPPPRVAYSYCDNLSASGPRGWAQTKLHFESDFMKYSMSVQQDPCDLLGREIQAHFSF